MRWDWSFSSAYGSFAMRSWLRKRKKPLPCNVFVPDFVMTFTTPPEDCPYSALKPFTTTWISWTASIAGLVRSYPEMSSLFSSPSRYHWLERERDPPKPYELLLAAAVGASLNRLR